jgi:hypothetical protein
MEGSPRLLTAGSFESDVKTLADRISSELRVLIGKPMTDCSRAANMQVFGFAPRRQKRNRRGEIVELGYIRLHIQCRWRFMDERCILFGRDDLLVPADDSVLMVEFDWDAAESALDVAQRNWFASQRSDLPAVIAVGGDAYGGFRISLAGGYTLECFPCDSRRDEYSEHWRLVGHRADGSHFVVTGDGIEGEGIGDIG